MPGPVSRGRGNRNCVGLEQRVTQTSFEVLASEAPGERLAKGGVASAESVNGVGQFLKAGVVIRLEHLALDNREVNFDLVEPARIGRRVDDDDARMACTQLFRGAFAAMKTVTGRPSARAACARARPWLPAEAVTSLGGAPVPARSRTSRVALKAPRIL